MLRNSIRHDLDSEAAQMAFYFLLSLFPFVLAVFALTGILGGDEAFARVASSSQRIMPAYAWRFVSELMVEVADRERPGLLSAGIALTLWAASSSIAALIEGLNTIYAVEEPRTWWKRRLLALGLLAVGAALVVVGATTVIPGVRYLRDAGAERAWTLVSWPAGFILLSALIWLAYRFLPARDQRGARRELLSGALLAAALWLSATAIFRWYIASLGSFDRSYGAVGAVIALMIWLYIAAMSVLIGAEFAATLELRRRHTLSRPPLSSP